jgi:hypothetical protein
VLANYLAGAQIALVQWWLEKHPKTLPKRFTVYSAQQSAMCLK